MTKRAFFFLLALPFALPSAAWALPVGSPGAALESTRQDMSVTGSIGFTSRRVHGDDFARDRYDTQSSFRFLVRGQYSFMPWFSPSITLGLNNRYRRLTDFSSELGPVLGLGFRIDPIIQRGDSGFGIALVPQLSYESSQGHGHYRVRNGQGLFEESPDVDGVPETLRYRSRTFHAELSLLFSRKEGRISFYGGPKLDWDHTRYARPICDAAQGIQECDTRTETVRPVHPLGVVVGLDYDVTPQIFFSAEMENFHSSAIYALVGGRF